MKKALFSCLCTFIIMTITAHARSRANHIADTIYYLIDTLHLPINDRMITVDAGVPQRFYTVHCPCLGNGIEPQFRCNTTKRSMISSSVVSSTKFVSIATLIGIIKRFEKGGFNEHYVLFFVEPDGSGFIKNRAFFLGSGKTEMVDHEYIRSKKDQRP